MIVAMDEVINVGGTLGAQEIVIGMAHRGRLNVLVNIPASAFDLFAEFEGQGRSGSEAQVTSSTTMASRATS